MSERRKILMEKKLDEQGVEQQLRLIAAHLWNTCITMSIIEMVLFFHS